LFGHENINRFTLYRLARFYSDVSVEDPFCGGCTVVFEGRNEERKVRDCDLEHILTYTAGRRTIKVSARLQHAEQLYGPGCSILHPCWALFQGEAASLSEPQPGADVCRSLRRHCATTNIVFNTEPMCKCYEWSISSVRGSGRCNERLLRSSEDCALHAKKRRRLRTTHMHKFLYMHIDHVRSRFVPAAC
jgi:hypothetical protein